MNDCCVRMTNDESDCVHDMKFDVRIQLKKSIWYIKKRRPNPPIVRFAYKEYVYRFMRRRNYHIDIGNIKMCVCSTKKKQNITIKRHRKGKQRINKQNTKNIWCNKTVWGGFKLKKLKWNQSLICFFFLLVFVFSTNSLNLIHFVSFSFSFLIVFVDHHQFLLL